MSATHPVSKRAAKARSFRLSSTFVLCLTLVACQGGREIVDSRAAVMSTNDRPVATRADDDIPLSVPPLTGFIVNPYLQNPGTDRMTVMFEPELESVGPDMAVEYRPLGSSEWLSAAVTPESIAFTNPDRGEDAGQGVYAARIAGLASHTTYEYRVITAAGTTSPMRFKTWPKPDDGVERGRFIVISDIQGNNPYWLTRVFEKGVIARDCDGDVLTCVERFAGVIITGDLVDDGDEIEQWRQEYFAVGDSLWRYLPQLMIIGNHDYNLSNYLYYAAPPTNHSLSHDEEWYQIDYLNFRFLGMQSNLTVQGGAQQVIEQTAFLNAQMADAALNGMDYLIMGIHAPCKSELWIPGESIQVCAYVRELELLSRTTNIITGHLFGHTHGYSRGQSRDVPHLWMNAASAGGRIDDWGDYAQADYDEFESTWDEYGYSILEFTTRGAPEIRSVRRTGGDDHEDYADAFQPTSDRDDFRIGGENTPPAVPVAMLPGGTVATPDVYLHARFEDAEDDAPHEAHWQLRRASGSFLQPLLDAWGNETRARNEWFRMNLNAGVDVDYWRVPYLEGGEYCWRVRFRDSSFAWSAYSEESCFQVEAAETSGNLLINGNAESGTEGWVVDQGILESLNTVTALPALARETPSLCGLGQPAEGVHWFNLGGCVELATDEQTYTVVSQSVDLSSYRQPISEGRVMSVLRLQMKNASKWDVPAARIRVFDAAGAEVAVSKPVMNQTANWLEKTTSIWLPPEATSATVELTGLRQDGAEGDAYIDDVRFEVVVSAHIPDRKLEELPTLSPGNGMAIKPKKHIDP